MPPSERPPTERPPPERPPPERVARNDAAILAAARTVFLRDPGAPVSAVATEAGVGISALYRRYAGRDDMVRSLCRDGLRQYLEIARSAAVLEEPWDALAAFLRGVVLADLHSLTVRLAGTFTPTPDLRTLAVEAGAAGTVLVERARDAGVLRAGLAATDVAMLLEQLAAVRTEDPDRTTLLRSRYLALHLDSWRAGPEDGALPGPPPTDAEIGRRWR